jgi:hypothetical protein
MGRTLSEQERRLSASITGADSAKLITETDKLKFRVMARADFDDDGTEDLLVRVDWAARDAMGQGSDLILLSRKSMDALVILT